MSATNGEMAVPRDPSQRAEEAEALSGLRRFARPRPKQESCELCSAILEQTHQHLLHRQSRQIACACDACAILFSGQEGAKFLRIPRRIQRVDEFGFSDLEWEAMMLPINLAFFLRGADGRMQALYPSPAGAIESQIDLDSLQQGADMRARFRDLEPEVEALLVNRIGEEQGVFVVPLDECYRLVGVVKTKWRGLSGGADVWTGIQEFFRELNERAVVRGQVHHA